MNNQIHSIYDNGNKTIDRYTVFTIYEECNGKYREALCLSDNPTHPLGFSQFSYGTPGEHCGKPVSFDDLPENIQQHINSRLSND